VRVSAEVKRQTRSRLLGIAHKLLARHGLQGVTTRDVADEAGLAHGTLFNYFPTKEALALALCRRLLAEAEAEFAARPAGGESLEEALFAHVAAGLRALRPFRPWAGSLLGVTFRPPTEGGPFGGADAPVAEAADDDEPDDPYELQARHLAIVRDLITRHRGRASASPVALHLYWSLYLGVLSWWSADASPRQEDTLVVLDQSMRMLTRALGSEEQREARRARQASGGPGHRSGASTVSSFTKPARARRARAAHATRSHRNITRRKET